MATQPDVSSLVAPRSDLAEQTTSTYDSSSRSMHSPDLRRRVSRCKTYCECIEISFVQDGTYLCEVSLTLPAVQD